MQELRQLISSKVQTSLEEQGTEFDNTLVDNMVNCYLEHMEEEKLKQTDSVFNYLYGY